jgi:putative CocE/NonD family hydrolase
MTQLDDARPVDLPAGVERTDHLWIPLPDGTRLAARLWLPEGARQSPVPAVLEYIPYRKGDATALRDNALHAPLAARGYACIRVDMRGSGESDGLLLDEYSAREQEDGLAVIDWIAAQDWCDGAVAMVGKSWGGVIALLLAGHGPPALKTVVPVGAVEDRYYDDAGYYMGCLNGETLGWGAYTLGLNARPPDPAVVGARWRDLWLERLEGSPNFLENWLGHQRRDSYWRFASSGEDYDAIKIPVFAVSGWVDCWPNTVPRLMERLSGPRRGIMGPWSHVYPHEARPGPGIDFIDELDRWFSRWLKGGAESEPDEGYLAWIQESVPPADDYALRPGFWAAEPAWPSPHVARKRLGLSPGRLGFDSGGEGVMDVKSPQTVGMHGGEYMPIYWFGPAPQLPGDQRAEDAGSLCFDSDPLSAPLDILGDARVELRLSCSEALGLVAARLCDVAPDGASTLITRGVMNLAQRDGRETPVALTPGEPVEVRLALNHVGYRLPPGHRLRLALSTSYWPLAWPAPRPFTLSVDLARSALLLPLRDPDAPAAAGRLPDPAPPGLPQAFEEIEPPRCRRHILTDGREGEATLEIDEDGGLLRLAASGLAYGAASLQRFSIRPDDPLSARMEVTWRWRFAREDWATEIEARTCVHCTGEDFILDARLRAWEGTEAVFERRWQSSHRRDHF